MRRVKKFVKLELLSDFIEKPHEHEEVELLYVADGECLADTDLSVTRIAVDNGFTTSSVMAREFKQYFGMTPKEFREKSRKLKNGEKEAQTEQQDKKLENQDRKYRTDAPAAECGHAEAHSDAEEKVEYRVCAPVDSVFQQNDDM